MTIRFTCTECSSVMKIKDELAGTSARCPKCKTKFVVPDPTDELASSNDGDRPSGSDQDNGESQNHDSRYNALASSRKAGRPLENQESTGDTVELNASSMESTESEPTTTNAELSSEPDTDSEGADSSDAFHLQLDDDEPEAPVAAPIETPIAAPVNSASSIAVDDDLDCPSMLVSPYMSQMKVETEVAEPRRFNPSRISAEVASDFTAKSPAIPKPTRREEPIDPMKFLAGRDKDDLDDDFEEQVPARSSRAFSAPPDSDADLSLSEDSDYEIPSNPTPQPMTRRTPAAPSSRPTPEKIDLATAAKMMKKAIKDSQADATRQREIEARPGFDYTLFFREFGLRGLAVLIVAVVAPAILYFTFDYMLSNKLKLPKLGYVNGTVKLDGQPLSGVTVFFAPTDVTLDGGKRERARTSTGITDKSGNFRMVYAPKIEGVAAGKCRVWIVINNDKVNFVPMEWMENSMRTVEIAVGSQKTPFDINLDSKKK